MVEVEKGEIKMATLAPNDLSSDYVTACSTSGHTHTKITILAICVRRRKQS